MFPEEAERALQSLNGKKIYNKEIKVNWAAHASNKDDSTGEFNWVLKRRENGVEFFL
jgi:RNA recognition motif-containing protein